MRNIGCTITRWFKICFRIKIGHDVHSFCHLKPIYEVLAQSPQPVVEELEELEELDDVVQSGQPVEPTGVGSTVMVVVLVVLMALVVGEPPGENCVSKKRYRWWWRQSEIAAKRQDLQFGS
jgi:hypothetical protein